jgi:hypothetical protein
LEKTKLKPTTPEEPPKNQNFLMLQNQDWRLSSSREEVHNTQNSSNQFFDFTQKIMMT